MSKRTYGMAKIVDSDQTAPVRSLIRVCILCSDLTAPSHRNFMVLATRKQLMQVICVHPMLSYGLIQKKRVLKA